MEAHKLVEKIVLFLFYTHMTMKLNDLCFVLMPCIYAYVCVLYVVVWSYRNGLELCLFPSKGKFNSWELKQRVVRT